jgi:hypothetical protein
MNDQIATTRQLRTTPATGCRCCAPPRPIVMQDVPGEPGRWAVCTNTSLWHENRGDGIFLLAAGAPTQATGQVEDPWAVGGPAPVLAPGVRIDLSRESYA